MIYNQLSEYLLKHLAQVQTLMMMSAGSEDAGFRSITRKSQLLFYLLGINRDTTQITKYQANQRYYDEWCFKKNDVGQFECLKCLWENLICEI